MARRRSLLAALLLGGTLPAAPAAPRCHAGGPLVDAVLRDAGLAMLARLAVQAPGQAADGAIRAHLSAGHVDPAGASWHLVSAYQVNLAVTQALRIAPANGPLAAAWLRWQARHCTTTGPGAGVVFDHWVRDGDLRLEPCPPGMALRVCPQVDAYDSTAATLLLAAEGYRAATGDAALLREPALRAALQGAAGTLVALTQPQGLTAAKPDHPALYLMDAVEVVAGWHAWARVQEMAYGDADGARAAGAAAQRVEAAIRTHLWDAGARAWRVSLGAGPPDFSRWYPDTVAQAWPLLWGVRGHTPAAAHAAWRRAARHWLGAADWSRRNVDPAGFWWPAVAVAAQCVGDDAAARAWVARAREAWLHPERPFAWPFQVGDLRWLFHLADPLPGGGRPVPS